MPLSPDDLQRAAMACRAAAVQARRDAERQSNPDTRAVFERDAAAYAALADRFDRIRAAKTGKR